MKKCIFAAIVLVFAILCANNLEVSAKEGDAFSSNYVNYMVISEPENNWSYGKLAVISTGYDEENSITIPATVTYNSNKYEVTEVHDAAFATLKAEEIILPYTVTYIGTSCFFECTDLEHLKLGTKVSYIGPGAFSYCDSLTELDYYGSELFFKVRDGVIYTSDLQTVVGSLFIDGEVEIPEGTRFIADYAFEGAVSLSAISLPESLSSIGSGAFCKCTSLEEVYIPENVRTMGYNPFMYCSSLKNIKVSSDNPFFVSKKGYILSGDKKNLICAMAVKGEAEIPSTVKKIKDYAFCGNLSLTGVTISSKIKTINQGAFYGCRNLTYVGFDNAKVKLKDGTKIFGNTNYFLEISVPYSAKGRAEFLKKIKQNCPSGTIYSGR